MLDLPRPANARLIEELLAIGADGPYCALKAPAIQPKFVDFFGCGGRI
jgi:hypothetical protein